MAIDSIMASVIVIVILVFGPNVRRHGAEPRCGAHARRGCLILNLTSCIYGLVRELSRNRREDKIQD